MAEPAAEPAFVHENSGDPDDDHETDSTAEARAPDVPSPTPAAEPQNVAAPQDANPATQRDGRLGWRSLFFTRGSIVAVCVVVVAIAVGYVLSLRRDRELEKECNCEHSNWKISPKDLVMIFGTITVFFGSLRLLNAGEKLTLAYLSHSESKFSKFLRQENIAARADLVFAILAPSWACLVMTSLIGEERCRDNLNPRTYLPAKTSEDIRGLLNVWWGLTKTNGNIILGVAQWYRKGWLFGFPRLAMLCIAIGAWSAMEMHKGPCWVNTRVFWTWLPCLAVIYIWFVVDKRRALLERKPWPWAELVLCGAALYLLWKSPLDVYCENPKCW